MIALPITATISPPAAMSSAVIRISYAAGRHVFPQRTFEQPPFRQDLGYWHAVAPFVPALVVRQKAGEADRKGASRPPEATSSFARTKLAQTTPEGLSLAGASVLWAACNSLAKQGPHGVGVTPAPCLGFHLD